MQSREMGLKPAPASLVTSRSRGPRTASGLCFYGYRYYDPVTGRWPSRDPIVEIGHRRMVGASIGRNKVQAQQVGLYLFCVNSGVSRIDVDGRSWCEWEVHAALKWAELRADRIAPDGTTHGEGNMMVGGDADALTHCIAGCMLRVEINCCRIKTLYDELQSREVDRTIPATDMDFRNNRAGWLIGDAMGTSVSPLRGGRCVEACMNALRDGKLFEADEFGVYHSVAGAGNGDEID